ncbi:MAG: diguanylate cyclase [Acaryochloridaceae cyanobacterium RL_2_7]|nr:diguanylate cyclase [Acaryochloridaceae cyanobacterium RL_2_7]
MSEIHYQEFNFTITATFGLAEYQPGQTLSQTLTVADTMLYQGKRRGRNRIETEHHILASE